MAGIDLAVLFVRHDTRNYPGAFDAIKAQADRIGWCRKTYCIVDNKNEGDYVEEIADGVFVTGGNDASREFSGWQRGVERRRERGVSPAVFLFLTDAVLRPGPSFLPAYGTRSLLKALLLRSAVGRIDTHGFKGTLLGREVTDWLCTGCFFMPRRLVERLGGLVTVDEKTMDLFMAREFTGEVFRKDAPISGNYREFIVDWLTRRRRPPLAVCGAGWNEFRGKVRAMFNEALLSVRIRDAGYRLRGYGPEMYY